MSEGYTPVYVITCNLWLVNIFFLWGSGKETRLHFLLLLLNKTIQFMLHQTFFWHFSSPIKNTNVCMYAYLLSLCLTCVSYKVFTLPLYKYILRGLSHAMNKQQETSQHISVYSNVSRVFLQWFITDSMSTKNPQKTRTLIIAVFLKMFQVKEQWACLDSFCSFCGKMSFFEKDKRWATFHISIWNLNDRQLKHICYVMQ